ncbi:hypothetical protein ARMGADRAFT_991497 [Armillaria gallica]|uniref:Protein kinase domain-containing protein n=1 Tax=Armillaria gallica TaxID=47427 RepID=A0A2H3DGN5_ARMGA|nr:hypothetical protein ARMGADRAFT_991497 [Armillaria gallica]
MDMEAADPFHLREILWSDGEDFFHLQLPCDKDDEARSARRDAKLVPCSLYQTIPPPELLCAPEPAIWQYMIQEARVCETLMKYPHQNVARYYGYVEKDGLMVGLCFKRYGQTLSEAVRTGLIRREDVEPSLDQIKRGIEHTHGLGLVHNDINPRNILFDVDGKLIIIDFDSCRKQSESMLDGKSGTFPFSNDPETAEFQNDSYGLEKVREWMKENIP